MTEIKIEIPTETPAIENEKISGPGTVMTSGITGKEISEIVKGTTLGTVIENGQILATKTTQETPDLKGIGTRGLEKLAAIKIGNFIPS